jgi:ribonuclease D
MTVEEPRVVTHAAPFNGTPAITISQEQIDAALAELQAGSGPLAVDAERASGYRYSQRAYLLQFTRNDSPIVLLDPCTEADLSSFTAFVNTTPWILHAATQDLPCLRERGFAPLSVFDTELAAKLLGRPRVGLGALLEQELGVVLAKEHSAVDWSTRPLPEEWLAYAALDVEFLVELHERLLTELDETGRRDWYEQERALLLSFTGPAPREDPWRRVSGIHALKSPRHLAVVRALWQARDERARELDVSPGRVLHDSVIVEIARTLPPTRHALEAMRPVHSRNTRKDPAYWWQAIEQAYACAEADLPRRTAAEGAVPPPRSWPQRNPEAAERWDLVRPAVVARAEELGLSAEVLVTPEVIRILCWSGFERDADVEAVAALLAAEGCRPWQVDQLAGSIAAALTTVPAAEVPAAD